MSPPVCVIVGIGPGNGAALARRFGGAGYSLALLTRNLEHTKGFEGARGYACDAAQPESIQAALALVTRDLGDPEVLIWNAGSGSFADVEHTTAEGFEDAWRVNALGALVASQAVIPAMKQRGRGAIVFIGATASLRGGPRSAAFSSAKAAQRSLAESMARHLWPAGIHVALVIIDGVVDLPRTRAQMKDKPDDFFVKPEAVAATTLAVVDQDRSAWSFLVEARPFGEKW